MKYLVDTSEERRSFATRFFPGTIATEYIQKLWDDPEVNAVVIATPASSHFRLAMEALAHGKHVFVEKPLATSVVEVDQMAALASSRRLLVMAGHTFLYNNAVRYIKGLIDSGELGDVRYIYSQRLNLGRIRSDIDALWNFAPHDISIIQYWLNEPEPVSVDRHGMAYMQAGVEDVVFLNLQYPNKVIANIHVSWLDPQKVRKMIVVGSKKMVVYDDVSDEKVTIYDKGIDVKAKLGEKMDYDRTGSATFNHRSGDIHIPKIEFLEPLRVEAQHFADCIRKKETPLTGVEHARRVVGILESASKQAAR